MLGFSRKKSLIVGKVGQKSIITFQMTGHVYRFCDARKPLSIKIFAILILELNTTLAGVKILRR